ncbi:transcriptional regulator NrdR [Candidatus Falkowbacteria bacterium CG10_big_fil_rev_8_21_14_0_10_39_9]|uniref:Transcriptional repressor NrdR n=1 Tax=Candidatus Falkowbacteria bacterium CG10_big_fil_rev_8_21_14_0_10_39_9 TaxID=1974566 RepID=A0A2M6WNG4_9BACT|nr:MAG: transcriptional regulator NrdR [Candidatus Falkowbacteria bacterium CG10_big_fil_rev_8_21_14_0_10_39_9]
MKCPICYHPDTKVLDSRVATDGLSIRRRRECLKCAFRFSTYEELEILDVSLIKRDGRREAYSRDKLISGLKKASEKRIGDDKFKKLIHMIERDIQALKTNEVSSQDVGKIVMKNLKKVDQIAYIRYASVYESFKNVQEFKRELNKLLGGKNSKK